MRTEVSDSGVSEQSFYEVFASVEDCVSAAFDQGLARITRLLVETARCERRWHERVSAVLAALLVFLDEEPCWARLLIDESTVATAAVCERRKKALATVARALVEETQEVANSSGWFVPSSELTAELVVGGVYSVLRTRMHEDPREPFAELAPSLTRFIMSAFPDADSNLGVARGAATNDRELQARRLPIRATYRTTRVLSAIDDAPGLSNREIAEAAGLTDEGQTSKLLRRLEQRGVVENFGLGQPSGGANAWSLTAYGQRVLAATRHSLAPGAGAVSGRRVRGAT